MSPRKAAFGMILLCVATVLITGPLAPWIRAQPRAEIEADTDMLRRILRFRRRTGLWPLDARELTPPPSAVLEPAEPRRSDVTFVRSGPPLVWRRLESWTGRGRLEHRLEHRDDRLIVRSHWIPQPGSAPNRFLKRHTITSLALEEHWPGHEAELILRSRVRREPNVVAHRLRLAALLQQEPSGLEKAYEVIPRRRPDGSPSLAWSVRRADLLRRTGRVSGALAELEWISRGGRAITTASDEDRLRAFAVLDRLGGLHSRESARLVDSFPLRPHETGVLTWLCLRRLLQRAAEGRLRRERMLDSWDAQLERYERWIDSPASFRAPFASPVYSAIFRALRELLAGAPGSACEAARTLIRRADDPALIRMGALALVRGPSSDAPGPQRVELPPLPVAIFRDWKDL